MSRHVLSGDETAPLRLCIADVPARVTGLPPHIRADMRALMRPFVISSSRAAPETAEVEIALSPSDASDHPAWRVMVGDEEIFRSGSHDRLLGRLEWLVVARAVQHSSRWLVWHAASLARGGEAVVLVGESGAGKSTLAVELALRGWRPLADDLTLIQPHAHTLTPFRRCFHIEHGESAQGEREHLLTWPAPALADYARPRRWAAPGAAPRWVVVVRRDTSQPTRLSPISRAEAAGALFGATIHNRASAEAAGVAASVAGAALGCYALNNNDLRAALDALTAALVASPRLAPVTASGVAARRAP